MKESQINILVLNVYLFNGTAAATRVLNLLLPLLKKKIIQVESLGFTDTSERDLINKKGVEKDIKFLLIGYKSPFNILQVLLFYIKGLQFILNNKKKYNKNVLYAFDYPDIKNILFIVFARLLGYKVIFDIEEDNRFYSNFQSLLGKVRNQTSLFFIKNISSLADHIIVISKHLQNRMQLLAKNKCKITYIPISVDLSYFPNQTPKVDSKELKIFYGGSFAEKDGVEYLLKAFEIICQEHSNVSLILTGKPVFTSDFKKLSPYLENNKKIYYKGFLQTQEYYRTLNSADIFCMTRVNSMFANGGFPFKLGEFLAAGKAVIATEVGDVPEYIVHKENAYLIKPDSVVEIVDAIRFFLTNPEKIRSMGTEARKTAEQYFDALIVSNKFYNILKEV